jgi:hypothetical protein
LTCWVSLTAVDALNGVLLTYWLGSASVRG